MKTNIELHPIGFVRSSVKEAGDAGWGDVVSEIVLDAEYAAGLTGLGEFSHVIVVFYMPEALFKRNQDLVRRPRGLADMPMVGIFAQRGKHRPNPLGITSVEITGVRDNVISVRGLDAISETPVLDIKPYFPVFDERQDAKVPEWVNRLMKGYF